MNNENVEVCKDLDPFWQNILNQVKTLRGKRVPPEKYREMIEQLETCLALAVTEVSEQIANNNKGVGNSG